MTIARRLLPSLRLLAMASCVAGASHAIAAKTYTDNGDGTVTDPTTGLTWMRCAVGQTWDGSTCNGELTLFDWLNANAYRVDFAGKNTWRLPTVRELQTIVDTTQTYPSIDRTVFPNASAFPESTADKARHWYWSATPSLFKLDSQPSLAFAHAVQFAFGDVKYYGADGQLAVRMVSGPTNSVALNVERPDSQYTIHNDGTVTHIPTGLMWQRCSIGQTWGLNTETNSYTCQGTSALLNWTDAKTQADNSNFAGHTDWRLPTLDEMVSLIDFKKFDTTMNRVAFPNASNGFFYTSTPIKQPGSDTFYANSAWVVHFWDGHATGDYAETREVRLVRGGTPVGSYKLTVNKTGSGEITSSTLAGIRCGTQCTGDFTSGTQIALTSANPFASWEGDCAEKNAQGVTTGTRCTVTMDSNKTVHVTMSSIPVVAGWNLLGNGREGTLNIAQIPVLKDPAKVTTMWKYGAVAGAASTEPTWHFYAPSMSQDELQAFAARKRYTVLSEIEAGAGFWVLAAQGFDLPVPAGNPVTVTSYQPGRPHALKSGWSLVAIGENSSPRYFNITIGTTAPPAGVVPENFTTLWAWDVSQKWYFYSPYYDNLGGTKLDEYIQGRGYLPFGDKLLGQGVGFWVNKP